jgi:hypothetical protein
LRIERHGVVRRIDVERRQIDGLLQLAGDIDGRDLDIARRRDDFVQNIAVIEAGIRSLASSGAMPYSDSP